MRQMYWSKLFIPTLREEPAEAQSAAHRLLIRAGYKRGSDYLFLGRRTLSRIVGAIRRNMEEIGGQKSIADISSFTGLPPTAQMKSLVVVADGETILALVRGDHQLDREKLKWFLGASELRAAEGDEIRDAFGADAGSLGPIGAKVR